MNEKAVLRPLAPLDERAAHLFAASGFVRPMPPTSILVEPGDHPDIEVGAEEAMTTNPLLLQILGRQVMHVVNAPYERTVPPYLIGVDDAGMLLAGAAAMVGLRNPECKALTEQHIRFLQLPRNGDWQFIKGMPTPGSARIWLVYCSASSMYLQLHDALALLAAKHRIAPADISLLVVVDRGGAAEHLPPIGFRRVEILYDLSDMLQRMQGFNLWPKEATKDAKKEVTVKQAV